MKTVFRICIRKIDDQLRYGEIEQKDMSEEDFAKFPWDRIIRCDFIQQDAIIYMADTQEKMAYFYNGICEHYSLINKWHEAFSPEKKLYFEEQVKKDEEPRD